MKCVVIKSAIVSRLEILAHVGFESFCSNEGREPLNIQYTVICMSWVGPEHYLLMIAGYIGRWSTQQSPYGAAH